VKPFWFGLLGEGGRKRIVQLKKLHGRDNSGATILWIAQGITRVLADDLALGL
jgi:hypothetical protein